MSTAIAPGRSQAPPVVTAPIASEVVLSAGFGLSAAVFAGMTVLNALTLRSLPGA